MGKFTVDELAVLRNLIEPKQVKLLVFSVLEERYGFPEWIHKAVEHGWEPPSAWFKEERGSIEKAFHSLWDRKWIRDGIDWKFGLCDRLQNEMTILAVQASSPRPDP